MGWEQGGCPTPASPALGVKRRDLLAAAVACCLVVSTGLVGASAPRPLAATYNIPLPAGFDVGTDSYAVRAPLLGNGTGVPTTATDLILRFSGTDVIPFGFKQQMLLFEAATKIVLPAFGPVELLTYGEYLPDGSDPTQTLPYVDVAMRWYGILNRTAEQLAFASGRYDGVVDTSHVLYRTLIGWDGRVALTGYKGSMRIMGLYSTMTTYVPQQVVMRYTTLLQLDIGFFSNRTFFFGYPHASAVVLGVRNLLVPKLASHVDLLLFNASGSGLPAVVDPQLGSVSSRGTNYVGFSVVVTAHACPGNATGGSSPYVAPQCPYDPLTALREAILSQEFMSLLELQGTPPNVLKVNVTAITVLPSPTPSAQVASMPIKVASVPTSMDGNATMTKAPWHLDRLDQRSLPLDDKFTADNDGTGVNVYVLATGVRQNHTEFGYRDGTVGSRVQGFFGSNGLDPLQDCNDSYVWHGYGTYAASLIAGRTAGVARNATIYSVRYADSCFFESPATWNRSGLPAALDAVIFGHVKPAVMLINTWWTADRFAYDDDAYISQALRQKLDAAIQAGLTVIAPAGIGIDTTPCDNEIAAHAGVISVASVDAWDRRSIGGTTGSGNASCIDIFAPGGGLGQAIVGADSASDSAYLSTIGRDQVAPYLVVGVAAQFLSQHPDATPAQVLQALQDISTRDAIQDSGSVAPNVLLYTNLTETGPLANLPFVAPAPAAIVTPSFGGAAPQAGPGAPAPGGGMAGFASGFVSAIAATQASAGGPANANGTSSSSSSSGTGAIVGGVVGGAVFISLVLLAAAFVLRRRRRQRRDALAEEEWSRAEPWRSDPGNWEIPASDIRILNRPDGSEWLLGRGNFGRVLKGTKSEVQEVAVKVIQRNDRESNSKARDDFIREIAMMKYVSRDRNIVQFYGACLSPEHLMLVVEFMEGGDLRDAFERDRNGRLRWWKRGKAVALDIARGLHFLHSNRVIHRDLKSKNILLTKGGMAKVGDVGMAKIEEGGFCTRDSALGTFAWAAPELLLGERCTEKVDIYSFGVVLWEIATQEAPMRGRMRSPRVPEEVPQGVADIITECMQATAAARPTAKELYKRLQECSPLKHGFTDYGLFDDEIPAGPDLTGELSDDTAMHASPTPSKLESSIPESGPPSTNDSSKSSSSTSGTSPGGSDKSLIPGGAQREHSKELRSVILEIHERMSMHESLRDGGGSGGGRSSTAADGSFLVDTPTPSGEPYETAVRIASLTAGTPGHGEPPVNVFAIAQKQPLESK